jgi:hypothetical protein
MKNYNRTPLFIQISLFQMDHINHEYQAVPQKVLNAIKDFEKG